VDNLTLTTTSTAIVLNNVEQIIKNR